MASALFGEPGTYTFLCAWARYWGYLKVVELNYPRVLITPTTSQFVVVVFVGTARKLPQKHLGGNDNLRQIFMCWKEAIL